VCAVGVTPANLPQAVGATQIRDDLAAQQATLAELHIDRAYLASVLVGDRPEELEIFCKAWRVRNGPRFAKTDFTLDFDHGLLVCPAGQQMPFTLGGKVQFPAEICAACPLRVQCTTSARGRSVQIHPDERLLAELRQRQLTPAGRARLRERVAVEHAWRTSAAGRAAVPATSASARTYLTFAAAQWCTTCTSSPVRPGHTSKQPEHR
jgi:hypothetical protein